MWGCYAVLNTTNLYESPDTITENTDTGCHYCLWTLTHDDSAVYEYWHRVTELFVNTDTGWQYCLWYWHMVTELFVNTDTGGQ